MPRYTDKTELSYDDFLRLEGLLTLARDIEAQSQAILRSVRGITGETDPNGHSADAIYNGYTARQLLEKLDVSVLPPSEDV
jgi:hypothetical protein